MSFKDNLLSDRARRALLPLALLIAAGAAEAQSPNVDDGSAEAGRTKSVVCAACHGVDGNSASPEWPMLAGQHARYIVGQLEAYKAGQRMDPGMRGFASTLSEEDMRDVGAWFASQTAAPKGADPSVVSRGEQIYRGGIPERGIAACIACHGPTGMGNALAGYPRVSHQHAAYLSKTLRAYRSGERVSDADMNQMMRNIAEMLLDDEIEALAGYMQGLQ